MVGIVNTVPIAPPDTIYLCAQKWNLVIHMGNGVDDAVKYYHS